tara:strand:- start:9 stop:200 length:192 start_codon:yes stop_codon:yes gene_type:complete
MSKIISHPIVRYNKRDINSYLAVKKNFFNVPIIDKIKTTMKMVIPELSYRVIKHTGAYEPKMR